MRKILPYLFICSLLGIALFATGVRIGQHTERINKATDLFLSLPPTATPLPKQKPISFAQFKHAGCRIEFLIPSNLQAVNQASYSAIFTDQTERKDRVVASVDCKQTSNNTTPSGKIAVPTIQVANSGLRLKVTAVGDMRAIVLLHPFTGKTITVSIRDTYMQLILASLKAM